MNLWSFNRIYLNLGEDFKPNHPLELNNLLNLYAQAKMQANENLGLYTNHEQLCVRPTMAHLVMEANAFINGLDGVLSEDNMASTTSLTQIRFLRLALLGKKKKSKISGYSMILLHCIYVGIMDSEGLILSKQEKDMLKDFSDAIYQLTSEYYAVRPDDEVAKFLISSHAPVSKEMQEGTCLGQEAFPDIPKRNVSNRPDE